MCSLNRVGFIPSKKIKFRYVFIIKFLKRILFSEILFEVGKKGDYSSDNFYFILQKLHTSVKSLFICLLLGIPILGHSSIRYNCHYEPSSVLIEEKGDWDLIRIKDLRLTQEASKPMIPTDVIHLLIPEGQEAESIIVNIDSSYTLKGRYRIKPAPMEKEPTIFRTDSTVYEKDMPYPGIRAKLMGTGSFGGNSITDIIVYPVDYLPVSGRIIVYNDLTIELFYKSSKKFSIRQLNRDPYSDNKIKKALKSIVDNDCDIPIYSYHPAIGRQSVLLKSSYPSYLVITTDSLIDAFEPLINWITKKGIVASAISVDTILQQYSYDPISNIHDSAGAIRCFLMDAYQSGTQWVLLGGDEEIVPVRYGNIRFNDTSAIRRPPSDLYYSDLDGNWNVDGDEFYGERLEDSVDSYSEFFTGRLPCKNSNEISNWIQKVLIYEKNPGCGNYDYLTRVFWTGADHLRESPGEIIENGSYPYYFEHDTTMLEDANGVYPRGSEVIKKMNEHFGWFNHYCHGTPDQLTVSASGENGPGPERDFLVSLDSCDVYFENLNPNRCRVESGNGLDSLNNKDYYGIMFIPTCYTGAYDFEHFDIFSNYCGPSLAKTFTTIPEKGGPAFLGYTRYSFLTYGEDIHLSFLDALFIDSLTNLGVAEEVSRSQQQNHLSHISHTLFGDPIMPVWTNFPSDLNISFDDSIPPELINFEIVVRNDNNPIKDAYICLWKDNEVYITGFTQENGKLTLTIQPETEGITFLTITKQNFIPFEDTVYISKYALYEAAFPSCKIKETLSFDNVHFEFYIPNPGKIQLDIYDLAGRRIKRIIDRMYEKGTHEFNWNGIGSDAKHIKTGIYFYQFQHKNENLNGKFLFLK